MDDNVLREMLGIVDDHFRDEELKSLLKEFIYEKAGERSVWSAITKSTYLMLGGTSPSIDRVAALTELVILSLDMVDDLQDRDNMDKKWMQCPQEYVLNAALSYLAMCMAELGAGGHARLMHESARLLIRSIEGQHRDVSRSVRTEEDYMAMVRQKSGSLLRFACCMGYALIEDLDPETVDRMNDLAECIGVMAQIRNDINDVLRYDLKNDLLQKKRTLPILFLLEDSREEFPPIGQFYEGEITADEFLRVKLECMQYIRDSGCIEYSEVIRLLHAEQAEKLYQSIPAISPWKETFQEIAIGRS